MALEGFSPVPLRVFGGLCTRIPRHALPLGLSPACHNVKFLPGAVAPRDPYGRFWSGAETYSVTNDEIVSLHAHYYPDQTVGALSFRNGGDLDLVTPLSSPANIATGVAMDARMHATSLFGRSYLAFPFNYDYEWRGGGACRLLSYDENGVKSASVGPPAGHPVSGIGSGVIAGAGGLSYGVHFVTVMFLMDTGYITRWGTIGSATSTVGNTFLCIGDLPLGPLGTVARIVAVTPANDSNFYWSSAVTVVNDNTTTAVVFDGGASGNPSYEPYPLLTDAILLGGEPARPYATLYTPSAPTGVVGYSDRLVCWGSRNKVEAHTAVTVVGGNLNIKTYGLHNPDFCGGVYSDGLKTMPNGWFALGGSGGFFQNEGEDWLTIAGPTTDGDSITTQARNDVYYIRSGMRLGVRLRARVNNVNSGAVVNVVLYDPAGSMSHTIPYGPGAALFDANNVWTTHEFVMPAAVDYQPTYVAIDIVATAAGLADEEYIHIDTIEFYDANDKEYRSTLKASRPGEPESFDLAEQLSVGTGDGSSIVNAFVLRDSLYVCKEKGLYVVRDNGDSFQNWPVERVDASLSFPRRRCVAHGEGWVVLLAREGLVLFDGSQPQLLTGEIDDLWRRLFLGGEAWVAVDTSRKLIKVGSSMAIDPQTNAMFGRRATALLSLDYREGFGDPVGGSGSGRKWSIETIDFPGSPNEHYTSYTPATYEYTYPDEGYATRVSYGDCVQFWNAYGSPILLMAVNSQRFGLESGELLESGGYLVHNSDRSRYDNTTNESTEYMTGSYQTAQFGDEVGRCVFDRVVARIYLESTADIRISSVAHDGTVSDEGDVTGATPAVYNSEDIEFGQNRQGPSLGSRIAWRSSNSETTMVDPLLVMSRFVVFLKNASYGSLRGHN